MAARSSGLGQQADSSGTMQPGRTGMSSALAAIVVPPADGALHPEVIELLVTEQSSDDTNEAR
ncbi:MAG: hypothetical protein V9E82_15905 [Candidatus Nanopelagicales bacterium]